MMEESDRERIRGQIFDLLALIGDPEAQRSYERCVPIADVPSELVCMWFDSTYRPELPNFSPSFSKEELKVLSEFNEFYDARVDALPCRCELEELQGAPEWPAIMERAKDALKRLAPDVLVSETWYPKDLSQRHDIWKRPAAWIPDSGPRCGALFLTMARAMMARCTSRLTGRYSSIHTPKHRRRGRVRRGSEAEPVRVLLGTRTGATR